jgi:hypothetical protein
VTLFIMIAVTAFVMRSGDPSPGQVVDDAAQHLAQSFQAARLEAMTTNGEAHLYVQPTGGSEGYGRLLGIRLPVGGDTVGLTPTWYDMELGAVFGVGGVSTGPLGDPAAMAVPLPVIVCGADGTCNLGTGVDAVTYYISHWANPTTVRAVTITRTGEVRVFRYLPSLSTWQ